MQKKLKERFPRISLPLISVAEASSLYGIKETTIRAWIDSRKIPFYKVGDKSVRISKPEFESQVIKRIDRINVFGGIRRSSSSAQDEYDYPDKYRQTFQQPKEGVTNETRRNSP